MKNVHFTRKGHDLSISLCAFSPVQDWGEPLLRNSFWRGYAITDGNAKLISKQKTWRMLPGQVLLIPPQCNISGNADRPFSLYYAHFTCSLQLKTSIPICSTIDPDLLKSLDTCVKEEDEGQFRLLMMKLVTSAMSKIPKHLINPPQSNAKIERAYLIMTDNIGTKLSNASLANDLNISESSLMRIFKNHTGSTPGKEHLRLRLNHAAELLQDTEKSIDQIAEACGFWDRNHFTRAFIKQWEIGPAGYRRTVATL